MKLIYLPFIVFSILSCKNQQITQIEKLHIDNIIQIKGETISQIPAGCYTAGIIKDTFLCLQNTCSENNFKSSAITPKTCYTILALPADGLMNINFR